MQVEISVVRIVSCVRSIRTVIICKITSVCTAVLYVSIELGSETSSVFSGSNSMSCAHI